MKQILLILSLIFSTSLVHSQLANQAPNIISCDDNNDGVLSFDLTINNSVILGSQNPNDFSVTYYLTQSEAENNIAPIATPASYFNSANPQVIYARITENSSGSYDTTDFSIEVLPIPLINDPSSLEICDDDLDGFTVFDLVSKNEEILNNLSNVSISYYETESDASSISNPISNPSSYLNVVANTQTIYVNVQDIITTCFTITTLDLIALDCTDSDSDGVIDSSEDLNSNGNLNDDDTDMDNIANYLDDDDDGDNVATINEINISSGRSSNQINPFVDTDSDLIENYLDDDDDGDNVLTIDEDYNNNGDPTDDDIDNSGIPDYLEMNVALSIGSFNFKNLKTYPNPSREIVYVENLNIESIISVYDIQGRQINVNIQRNTTNGFKFNTRNLNRGIYLVKIQDGEKQKSIKLVVDN